MPDIAAFTDLKVTVLGRCTRDEDPVTGSANAGLALWLIGSGALPTSYVARQGSAIGREGRVHIEADAGRVGVSGDAVTRIVGEVDLQSETWSTSAGHNRVGVGHYEV